MKNPPANIPRNAKTETSLFIEKGTDLPLSDAALVDLLNGVVEKRRRIRFQATGHSMSPFIKDGDVLTIAPLMHGSARQGDVVAYVHPNTEKFLVHRVVGKVGEFYFVRGDNAAECDDFVPEKDLLGSVTKVERNGKNVFLGIGPEKLLISFLTRRGLLFPLLSPVWKIVCPIVKRLAL